MATSSLEAELMQVRELDQVGLELETELPGPSGISLYIPWPALHCLLLLLGERGVVSELNWRVHLPLPYSRGVVEKQSLREFDYFLNLTWPAAECFPEIDKFSRATPWEQSLLNMRVIESLQIRNDPMSSLHFYIFHGHYIDQE